MARPAPGEVWRVDLGLAAKVRPCLIFSDYPTDDELVLIVVVPHTTAVRGNRWEVASSASFLKQGVFHLQQIQPVSLPRLETRIGILSLDDFRVVKRRLAQLLRLNE